MASNLDLNTITGDIQNTFGGSSLMADDLTRIQLLKQWFNEKRSHLKPWTEFFNAKRMSKPSHIGDISTRVITNVRSYQANYICICILLVVYCV